MSDSKEDWERAGRECSEALKKAVEECFPGYDEKATNEWIKEGERILQDAHYLEMEEDYRQSVEDILEEVKYAQIDSDIKDKMVVVCEELLKMIPEFMKMAFKLEKANVEMMKRTRLQKESVDANIRLLNKMFLIRGAYEESKEVGDGQADQASSEEG